MHKVLPLVALAVTLSSAAFAQQKMGDKMTMAMGAKPTAGASAMTHHATGVVKKIDAKSAVVTFAHEPVKSLNWPAMTMGFQVRDKMLLKDKLSVGKKVEFDFEQAGNGYVVTAVK